MKIVFMGTPVFSVGILKKICEKHQVVLVVTQPDTYNIKKKRYEQSPVKKWALENNLQVFQPESIKKEQNVILSLDVDLIVTAAYGQIVGKKLLEHPKYKAINVHGSLLPKYRGGAPIQRAIINGDDKTGITIMYMATKMDAGDMIEKREIPILDSDTQDSVFEKLSNLASEMILDVIEKIEKDEVNPIKQNEDEVTYAYNLTKEDELIDFNLDARSCFNRIRGLNSNPTGYFIIDDANVKVYNSRVVDRKCDEECGKIVKINKDSFEVACKDGTVLAITEIKMPSKNRMFVRDFLNGQGRNILVVGKKLNALKEK